MTRAVARILSILGFIERRYKLDLLEKEERAIFHLVVDQLAAGQTVWLSEIANSGLTSRPSIYRHVRNLVKKDMLETTGSMPKVQITLSSQLSGFDKVFYQAVAKLNHSRP